MIPVLTPQQAREFDSFALESCGVPGIVLMENAGLGAAQLIRDRALAAREVCVVCGPGNNGGDGFVVARHLLCWGVTVRVVLLAGGESLSGDAATAAAVFRGVGGSLLECSADASDCLGSSAACRAVNDLKRAELVVDAIFGTGLNRQLSDFHTFWVRAINELQAEVVALDTPSGLNAGDGSVEGLSVVASETLVFGHPKMGLMTNQALQYTGQLRRVSLGVPDNLGPASKPIAWSVEAADAVAWLPRRQGALHKGRAGRVLVFAGSPGKTGAAVLTATAALRAGAGLVTVATFPDSLPAVQQHLVEVMSACIDPERIEESSEQLMRGCDVVVIGPGLGLDARARSLVDHVVLRWPGLKIVDADALTHFGGRAEQLAQAAGQCLLTPHPGELGGLLGCSAQQVEANRLAAWQAVARSTAQTLLLKGPYTLVGQAEQAPYVCAMGSAVLATAGSGDVLAGICGALAVGLPLARAGAVAAVVHGHAGCCWAESRAGADRGLLARELLDALPAAFASLAGASSLMSQ